MLVSIGLLVFAAALAGIVYLFSERRLALAACEVLAGAAAVGHLGWLIRAGMELPYCALVDPWGIVAIIVILGIGASWHASRRFKSSRILIWALTLLALAIGIAHPLLPPPGSADTTVGWTLAFHILLVTLGFPILGLGLVAGLLILLRSRSLKSGNWLSEVPWPALTALDRLFSWSLVWGALLLAGGMAIGLAAVPGAGIKAPWYYDTKVVLTSLGCALYGVVWYLHRKQGFATRTVVLLASLGFALVLFGFFASNLLHQGFHSF